MKEKSFFIILYSNQLHTSKIPRSKVIYQKLFM